MSATYSPNLTTALDRLRFRLGDTDTDNPDFDNATYQAQLDVYDDDEPKALYALAKGLLAKYTRLNDHRAGTVSEEESQRYQQVKELFAVISQENAGYQGGFRVLTPTRGATVDEFGVEDN